mmetsp:Transcript_111167/g.301711  ORF Transcript_111167/g.301711 Transcript_111167/m.301711 type:complete len:119 (-) Transcript_111167:677-1033(-)
MMNMSCQAGVMFLPARTQSKPGIMSSITSILANAMAMGSVRRAGTSWMQSQAARAQVMENGSERCARSARQLKSAVKARRTYASVTILSDTPGSDSDLALNDTYKRTPAMPGPSAATM